MSEFNWGTALQGIGAALGGSSTTTSTPASTGAGSSNVLLYGGIALVAVVAVLFIMKR